LQLQLNGPSVTINGSLQVLPSATITIDLAGTASVLNVTGNVTLGGTLQIFLSSTAAPTSVPIAHVGGSIIGQFQQIIVSSASAPNCLVYGGDIQFQSGLLSVLLTKTSTCHKKSRLPAYAIAIIVVGVVAIVAVGTFFVVRHFRTPQTRRRVQTRLDH